MVSHEAINTSNTTNDYIHHGHSLSNNFSTTVAVYFSQLFVVAVNFNILLIRTILMNKILHSPTNAFVVNLAFCDLFTAVSILPFEIDFLVSGYYRYSRFVCGLKETIFIFFFRQVL